MNAAGAKPRRRRIFWRYLLAAALAVLLLIAGLVWYLNSNSFQAMVRGRLVAELEKVTGGRVELGSIHTSPFRLRVAVRDLTIHGRENPSEVPFVHVNRIVARVKIISVLGAEFGFHTLVLDHPTIHVIVYPDGSTNQPAPKIKQTSKGPSLEQLFQLSISRLEVRRGEAIWNDQKIPLDFAANDVSAEMTYSMLHRRYACSLLIGRALTKLENYRPLAWMAEAHFTVSANGVQVGSLRISSGRSRLEASGHLSDFRNPSIEATYNATLNLAEFAAITRRSEARGGIVELQGQGTWSAEQLSSAGKLAVKDFSWRDRYLNISGVGLNTQFSITPQRLALSQIDARALGGSATGNAEVNGWMEQLVADKGRGPRSASQQNGSLVLRVKDISAGALAAAVSRPTLPLRKMNLVGRASGTVEVRWKGSIKNAEPQFALNIAAPATTPASQLPLNARLRATYHASNGELDVGELTATTRASQIHASGRLASSGSLQLSVSTSDLHEWQPILAAFGRPEQIPAVLQGHAAFNGTAAGTIPDVTLAGNLQAQGFDFLIPATLHTSAQSLHWDSLTSGIRMSPHVLALQNGVLQQGDTVIRFSLAAGLNQGQLTAQSPFTARVALRHGDVEQILALAGRSYPIRGKVNLLLEGSGTREQPDITGHLRLMDASIYGESVSDVNSDLHFSGGKLQLSGVRALYHGTQVTGSGDYDLSSGLFHFSAQGANFDLSRLPRLQRARLKVEGRLDFTAQGSGTAKEPAINATFRLHDLVLDHERTGDFTLEAVTRGPELHLSGRSQFPTSELAVDGDVHLRGDWPSTINVHFTHLDADALLRVYLRGRLTGHSAASGHLQANGPLRRPADLSLAGTLDDLSVDIQNMKLHNQGPVSFAVSDRVFRLEAFHLLGEDTDLSASGTVALKGDRQLDLHSQGRVNLKLLESYDPDFTSSGMLAVDMNITGTLARPVTQGRLQITNGAIAYLNLPSAFSDVAGSLAFNQNRLQIETLTAHTGGGQVAFSGFASWQNHQLSFDLGLKEQDVRLRYPPGVSSTANADLHFVGSSSGSTLSGDVTVTKLSVTPGFDFGAYLARSARTTVLPPTNPVLNKIRLDVHIVTVPELQMQTAIVRLSGDADLHVRGTAAKPILLGRADVLEGQVYFNGTKYELERGEVSFANPVTTTPVLDLQATTHVRDYDITLSLNGEPDKLKVTYRSEPPLPEADIITLLALGRTTQESAQLQQQSGQSAFTQEASSAIINQALNATVSNRAQRLFGVSRIKIDPAGLNTETSLGRGPAVTIEQQVADNLTITYSTSVEQASQQIIQVVYNLTHNISVVAIRDQNGVASFDVRIRQRKR
jgi:translocation and assembly module TamB